MLKVRQLTKIYYKDKREKFYAIENISFDLKEGETLSIVGESGSGKSTIGEIIAGIIKADQGEIYFKEEKLKYPIQKKLRSKIQILFQHPESAFNPSLKIIDSIKEPFQLYKKNWKVEDIVEEIKKLGLREEYLYRYPRELSGGELQRLAIVRALSVDPQILVLDEPTSMLDVVSQAQIIDILRKYQEANNTSYIFITHDRKLSEIFSDREIFIDQGQLLS